jgi:hypothetical protein
MHGSLGRDPTLAEVESREIFYYSRQDCVILLLPNTQAAQALCNCSVFAKTMANVTDYHPSPLRTTGSSGIYEYINK